MQPMDRGSPKYVVELLTYSGTHTLSVAYWHSLSGAKKFVIRFLRIFIPTFLEKVDEDTIMNSIANAISTLSEQSFKEIIDGLDKENSNLPEAVRITNLETLLFRLSRMRQLGQKRACGGDIASYCACRQHPPPSYPSKEQRKAIQERRETMEKMEVKIKEIKETIKEMKRVKKLEKEIEEAKEFEKKMKKLEEKNNPIEPFDQMGGVPDAPSDAKSKHQKGAASPPLRRSIVETEAQIKKLEGELVNAQDRVERRQQQMSQSETDNLTPTIEEELQRLEKSLTEKLEIRQQCIDQLMVTADGAQLHGQHAEKRARNQQKSIRKIGNPTPLAEQMLGLDKLIGVVKTKISEIEVHKSGLSPRSKV